MQIMFKPQIMGIQRFDTAFGDSKNRPSGNIQRNFLSKQKMGFARICALLVLFHITARTTGAGVNECYIYSMEKHKQISEMCRVPDPVCGYGLRGEDSNFNISFAYGCMFAGAFNGKVSG